MEKQNNYLKKLARKDIFEAIKSFDYDKMLLAFDLIKSFKDNDQPVELSGLEQDLLCSYASYSLSSNLKNFFPELNKTDSENNVLKAGVFDTASNLFFKILSMLINKRKLSRHFSKKYLTPKSTYSAPTIIKNLILNEIYYGEDLKELKNNFHLSYTLKLSIEMLNDKNQKNLALMESEEINSNLGKDPGLQTKQKI